MSDYTTNSTVNLSINGKDVEEKLDKYQKKLVELREKAQKAAEIGDKGTLQKTQKEIVKVENQMRRLRNATANVDETLRNLDKAGPKQLKKDLRTLKSQLENIERGSDAWNAHIEKIKILETELKKINSEMKVSEGFWDSLNRKMNDWQTTLAAGIATMTGVVMAGRSAVNAYAEMDAEMANVRKFTGMTAEQVEDLNEEFKKIDTRTSREELNKLAQEAGRLGKQSKEDVLGFVKAADIINVALDDLGDGATLTLSKLTNIFGDEKIYGTEQSLLKVGSVINELSQNCTASAPYLANFAQRLAGVGAQAKMTIPEIMGYAAVLDSQGQAVEMSATALSKLIMDLFKDSAKIAKATGMDLDKFNSALKRSTNEGLMMLLDRLHEMGNMDALAPVFKDMGESGARASAVIASLAGKIDMVKWEQQEANKAFEEGNSVINEFNVQNTTVQAGLDKAKKGFNEMAVELGEKLQPIMAHVISSTSVLMRLMSTAFDFIEKNIATIISLATSIGLLTVTVKSEAIATAAATAATKLKVFWNEKLIAGTKNLFRVMKAHPYLAIAAAVATIIGLYTDWIRKSRDLAKSQENIKKIEKEAEATYKSEESTVRRLSKVIHDNSKSVDERKTAIKQLQEIIPDYHASIDKEGKLYEKNAEQIELYCQKLKLSAQIQAASTKLLNAEEEYKDFSDNTPKNLSEALFNQRVNGMNDAQAAATANASIAAFKAWKAEERQLKKEIDDLNQYIDQKSAEMAAVEAKTTTGKEKSGGGGGGDGDDDKKSDKFAKEKAWKEKELALNRIAYATGKKDYEEYQNAILEIEKEYQTKILARKDLTEQESLNAQADFHEAELKLTQNGTKAQKEAVDDYYQSLKAIEDQRYVDGKISVEQYNNALNQLELKHLRDIINLYKEGSKERNDAEAKYDEALLADKKRNRKKIEEAEKEHRKRMEEISKDVFGDTPSKQKAMFNAEISALTQVYENEKAIAAGNKEDLLRIEENFQKAKMALAYKYNQITAENGFNGMQIANEKLFQWLESEEGEAVIGAYNVVMDGMTNIFAACSDIIQAELELETAAIEKRYEKEISAAEGNRYKVKKIEEKKQKEEAAAKNKANKKMYAMQVLQAIASTAMGAINAYSSAAQVPLIGYILAPIAAATAIAAGMLQVANIKKQQQASEAQGYAEGGYTGAGGKYEPRGIVHAGEWVASQKLLANPQTAAIIQSLDYAQKTNTIGSISPSMVSNDTTAAASIARLATTTQSSGNESLSETLAALNKRLNEPFVTVNTMTGDHGIKQAQEEYDIYIRNKTPKSRRQ
jgi:TP901 family phage tail tape measure protein